MTFSNLRTMMATAVLGAGLMSLATASAEEPGVVRISDGIKQTAARLGGGLPPAPLPSEVAGEEIGAVSNTGIHPLPEGQIINNGYVYYGDDCKDGRRPACCMGRNALPPDYGFYPPTPYPYVRRQPVIYQRYLPDQPYGAPGVQYSASDQPMVYMPTDTTQLGFNYMYVPQWLPNRNNYPMAPNPIMWQRREVPWPKWEDPSLAKRKHFHFGRNEQDLLPGGQMYLPNQPKMNGVEIKEIEQPAPAPGTEASLETDAQI